MTTPSSTPVLLNLLQREITMHVLILGARAPVCLELARAFKTAGWTVSAADSLQSPISRFSAQIDHFHHLPSPRFALEDWTLALKQIIVQNGIEWVIPTCEEAFYLSHQKPQFTNLATLFVDDFRLMHQLHHKGLFAKLTENWPICAPESQIITHQDTLTSPYLALEQAVFKPAYSRFGSQTLIRPTAKQLAKITPTKSAPWVIQRYVKGQEFCSYSILQQGQVTAHACYQPTYRAGKGAGIYLEPQQTDAILEFVTYFGQQTHYTGQVAFDYMQDAQGRFWVIECNPRATSGVHFFKQQAQDLVNAIYAPPNTSPPAIANLGMPLTLKTAMWTVALPKSLSSPRQWLKDYRRATDILHCPQDPISVVSQWRSLGELLMRSIKQQRSIWQVSTEDIEWNGQTLQ